MIASDAYNFINVLNKAADASWIRNNVISNNIANNDTPGYKRKDVRFESFLERELMGGLDPVVYTDYSNLSYRADGNNVDIHTENAYLAENQLRYQTLTDCMIQEFSRLKTALTATTA